MTPQQIRQAFNANNKKQSGLVKHKINPHSHERQAVSVSPKTDLKKVARLASALKDNKLIIDTPIVCLKPCVFYKTPDWFEKKNKHAKPRIKQLVKKGRNNNDTLFYDDLTVLTWEQAKDKYLCQVGR